MTIRDARHNAAHADRAWAAVAPAHTWGVSLAVRTWGVRLAVRCAGKQSADDDASALFSHRLSQAWFWLARLVAVTSRLRWTNPLVGGAGIQHREGGRPIRGLPRVLN